MALVVQEAAEYILVYPDHIRYGLHHVRYLGLPFLGR